MSNRISDFINGLTDSELVAIFEAARIALADAEIAEKVGERMDLSDAYINHLQNKVHVLMLGDEPSPE
jgi:cyanate lyase